MSAIITWRDDFHGWAHWLDSDGSSAVEIADGVGDMRIRFAMPSLATATFFAQIAQAYAEINEHIQRLQTRAERVKQLMAGTLVETYVGNEWVPCLYQGIDATGIFANISELNDGETRLRGRDLAAFHRIRFAQPISRPSHGAPITPKRPFSLVEHAKSFDKTDITHHSLWTLNDDEDRAYWSCSGDFAYCYAGAQALPYRRERVSWVIYRSHDGLEVAKWNRGDNEAFYWADVRRQELADQGFNHGAVGLTFVHEIPEGG